MLTHSFIPHGPRVRYLTNIALSSQDTAQPLLLLGKTDNKNTIQWLTKIRIDVDKNNGEKPLQESG